MNLLNTLPIGEYAYAEFWKSRLEEKSVKLFDTIPKIRILTKLPAIKKKIDRTKEVTFLLTIDYARLRDYNIKNLIKHEITTASFYLKMTTYANVKNLTLLLKSKNLSRVNPYLMLIWVTRKQW